MEFIDNWRDRADMGKVFVYERVVVTDRSAAMPSESFLRFQCTAASAFTILASASWWSPIWNNVVGFAGLDTTAESANLKKKQYSSHNIHFEAGMGSMNVNLYF